MNLIERHQAYLLKQGFSVAQVAKAYGQRPPRQPKLDGRRIEWVHLAREAALASGIRWNIPDLKILSVLEKVEISELTAGVWVLARWTSGAHQPGNSVFIRAAQLEQLNTAANRAIQRALLATLFASQHAIPVGAPPPIEATTPSKVGLGSKPVIPLLEVAPRLAAVVHPGLQLSAIDFHFMEQQAKELGFGWSLTGVEFNAILATAPAQAGLVGRRVCLYPRNARKAIAKNNVQWGWLDSLDSTSVKDYQIALDDLAATPTLNSPVVDPLWEIAGHPSPERDFEISEPRQSRIVPKYDEFLTASPEKIVDWFHCTLEQWDLIPYEIRKAYVWFKHWSQNTKPLADGTLPKSHGFRMTLPYFAESVVAVGGLLKIGSGPGQLLPIRINLKLPYQPGNVVLMSRKLGLKMQGQLMQAGFNTMDRHIQCIRDLKKGLTGVYYRDADGQFYFPNADSSVSAEIRF